MCFTSFVSNSSPSKDIMTSDLETFFPYSELLVTPRDLSLSELMRR